MKRHLCGVRAVQEALEARPRAIAMVWVLDDSPKAQHRALIDMARDRGINIEVQKVAALNAVAAGVTHQGIIAISGEDYAYFDLEGVLREAKSPALLVALDEITDPHNLGAIVRSAVALGADGVVTLKDRAAPVTSAVVRSSAGATEHARIARVTNLARSLRDLAERGFTIVGLAGEGERTLGQCDLRGDTVIVVGSEGRGLRRLVREVCTEVVKIEMAGPIASLNASVAAAIGLYEVQRQRSARE